MDDTNLQPDSASLPPVPPSADEAAATRLDDLVAQALDELDRGGDERLALFLAAHPDPASSIRRRIDDLRARGLLQPLDQGEIAFPERLGDFRLIRSLGSGGMGVVYLAEQVSLKRRVALKLLQPAHLYFPHSRERFRREIDTVSRLKHPGIVPIYMVGEEQGLPFFAMERVDGCSLAEVLHDFTGADPKKLTGADLRAAIARRTAAQHAVDEPASEQQGPDDEIGAQRVFSGSWSAACLRLLGQVAEALGHAHARGVLHRDVKPSNIMVTTAGRALLVDFGLATLEGSTRLTRGGTHPGSVPYMSPEQVSGTAEVLDVRTDVYSLGVTLYEALALRPAYDDSSTEATRRRIVTGDVSSLRTLLPGIDRDVETVCMKAMEVDANRRYSSATDFALDLERVREGRPIDARPPGALRILRQKLRQRRWQAAAVALVVLGTAVGFLAVGERVQWNRDDADRLQSDLDLRDATARIFAAIQSGHQPAAADLATFEAHEMVALHADAFNLLRNDPLSELGWKELSERIPSAQDSGVWPLAPRAGILDPSPLFRFRVPPELSREDWLVTVEAPGRPPRTAPVTGPASDADELQVRLGPEPFELDLPYRWTVARASDGATTVLAAAEFVVRSETAIEAKLMTLDTGDADLNHLSRGALLVHDGLAERSLSELAQMSPNADPALLTCRLFLEATAHVLLADPASFDRKREEAAKRAAEVSSARD